MHRYIAFLDNSSVAFGASAAEAEIRAIAVFNSPRYVRRHPSSRLQITRGIRRTVVLERTLVREPAARADDGGADR